MRTRTMLVALGVAWSLVASGCTGETAKTAPPEPLPGTPTSVPSNAEPTVPASEYTKKELTAFDDALVRYERYQEVSEPIWAAGKATPKAQRLIRDYYVPWQSVFTQLQQYEVGQIRTEGVARVLYAKPKLIKLDNEGAGVVQFRACIDGTGQRDFQGDVELEGATDKPQWVAVEMAGYTDQGPNPRWLILTESNPKGKKPCPAVEQ